VSTVGDERKTREMERKEERDTAFRKSLQAAALKKGEQGEDNTAAGMPGGDETSPAIPGY
jgi:hypothetical protein